MKYKCFRVDFEEAEGGWWDEGKGADELDQCLFGIVSTSVEAPDIYDNLILLI